MMLLLRWAGALIVAIWGGSIGLYLCHRCTLRRKTLQQVQLLLQTLRAEICYRKTDLTELYVQIHKNDQFQLLSIPSNGTFDRLTAPACLKKEEAACFSDCFSGLGMTGKAQECDRLDYFLRQFSEFAAKSEAEEIQSRQLYTRLGFGAGIMAAIALL